jgi:hypothetical protein
MPSMLAMHARQIGGEFLSFSVTNMRTGGSDEAPASSQLHATEYCSANDRGDEIGVYDELNTRRPAGFQPRRCTAIRIGCRRGVNHSSSRRLAGFSTPVGLHRTVTATQDPGSASALQCATHGTAMP